MRIKFLLIIIIVCLAIAQDKQSQHRTLHREWMNGYPPSFGKFPSIELFGLILPSQLEDKQTTGH